MYTVIETTTKENFIDKENKKDFESVFNGIIEKQTQTTHLIGNLTEHFSNKGSKHEIELQLLSESHESKELVLSLAQYLKVCEYGITKKLTNQSRNN